MFPDSILNILLADNPWLEGDDPQKWMHRYIPDTYITRNTVVSPDEMVSLVIGPRQVGKSTLIWKTLQSGDSHCLLVNCE